MPRKTLRTYEEITGMLSAGGLELAEEYVDDKSYPKNYYIRTRCRKCGIEADYRLKYISEKSSIGEAVCRACYWREWAKSYPGGYPGDQLCRDKESAKTYVEKHGYELVEYLPAEKGGIVLLCVKCRKCGRQEVEREFDVSFGCTCQSHPSTATHYAPPVTREVELPKETHDRKTIMSIEEAKLTPCSDVPELMEAWDDARDPRTTMVWPTSWRGMIPGDGQFRFKCKNGHHPAAFPYSYLENGCPSCRGLATRGTGPYLADAAPELAAEWIRERNGKWTPENTRDSSKRTVWWRCLACGNEWEATPRSRMKRDGQVCPSCGKIQGSIAWTYPRIADEWDSSNPRSPWTVRPHAKLAFTPLWNCPKNPAHKWRSQVGSRIAGAECPECVDSNKSRIELRYFETLRKTFGYGRSGARYERPEFSNSWSVDISLRVNGMDVAVEYDGKYWHEGKKATDGRKSRELLDAGFIVVRVREEGLEPLGIESPRYGEIFVRSGGADFLEDVKAVVCLCDDLAIATID